jgi:two-component system response regulator NreC
MKIIIADDHALVRNALTFMLNAQPDMEVVGDAADGNEVFMKLENTQADLVLMDISMPPGKTVCIRRAGSKKRILRLK